MESSQTHESGADAVVYRGHSRPNWFPTRRTDLGYQGGMECPLLSSSICVVVEEEGRQARSQGAAARNHSPPARGCRAADADPDLERDPQDDALPFLMEAQIRLAHQ